MATTASLRICPVCTEDLGEIPKGQRCPRCGSEEITKIDERREYFQRIGEAGYKDVESISNQLDVKQKKIETEPSSPDRDKQLKELIKEGQHLIMSAPMSHKIGLARDLLISINHQILNKGEDSKELINLGIKIGKMCQNLDEWNSLRFRR